MLSTFSIRALNILIIDILNFLSDNYTISNISQSGSAVFTKLKVFFVCNFCFLICFENFSLKAVPKGIPEKTSTFTSLTTLKPLTVWITTVENSLRGENTRPPYLSLEKPIFRSRRNS